MKVRYSRRALLQLDQIHTYTSQHNPRAANAVIERIEELCEKLGEFPGMGHKTEHPHVRALSVVRYPYVIFYTLILEADEVLILRVRHGRRRPLGPRET